MRRPILIAAATMLSLGLGACGIPVADQATVVPRQNVPYHLLSPTIPTSTTTTQPAAAYVTERIYLLRGASAVQVRRDVAVPATVTAVLGALLAGPTAAESSLGLTTALPVGVSILSVDLVGEQAIINLSKAINRVSGAEETQAVAQIVLTATMQPGISSVLFQIEGRSISVPTGGGVSTSAPVSASDFASVLAPTPSTTPTP
ncbi:MAG: GerMN domain-containing protein [Actinomycetes bacterium]